MNIKQDEANTKGNRKKKWEFAGDVAMKLGPDVLTKLCYVEDECLGDAVQLLLQKRRLDETWILESAPTGRMQTNIETVGKPSKWITLYALRVLKRLHKLDSEELKDK